MEHDFEALLEHKNDNVLHNVSLTECRVPSNFGELSNFKKSLATFLLNLSRHKDDPVVSVAKKLENRAEAALSCKTRVEEALSLSEPNLVTLKCLNDELSDLNRFYTEQSSYLKWGPPNFVISATEMTDLRERLLTKMDLSQSLRSQLEDEHRQLNKNFLESKSLPKSRLKPGPSS